MTREKKVEEAILRGIKLMPGDVAAQLRAMLTPLSLSIMVASLVGLAIAQAFGIGELIDALVLLAGIGFCGWGVVDGGHDLFRAMHTALNARTEHDLDEAGRYFASAVVKIGVNAVMAFLLKKPLRSFAELKGFKFRNVKPGFVDVGPPPAPGTEVAIQYQPLPKDLGATSPYGEIVINSRRGVQTLEEAKITENHEMVHRLFSPKFGPLRRLRASVRISAYVRTAMLRYLEEAMAEGYAQIRAKGWKEGLDIAIHWPVKGGYLNVQEMSVMRGTMLGTIVVDGHLLHVSLEPAAPSADTSKEPAAAGAKR